MTSVIRIIKKVIETIKTDKMQLSKYLTLEMATRSHTAKKLGIPNKPTEQQIINLIYLANYIIDPVCDTLGVPFFHAIFRHKGVNKHISGASINSEHCEGRAVDMDFDGFEPVNNARLFDYIAKNLNFNQLIWELGNKDNPAWVHCSYFHGHNQNKITLAVKEKGYTKYYHFITLPNFYEFKNQWYEKNT